MIDALLILAEFDDTGIAGLINHCKRKRAFSPVTLSDVIGHLETCNIPFNISDFTLDYVDNIRELLSLSDSQLDTIRPWIPEELYQGLLKRRGQ